MKPTKTKTYLALGDSMSIDRYTGQAGGGAVNQLYKRLHARHDADWHLIDESYDGCTMAGVPLTRRPGGVDLVTLTCGGNDLLINRESPPEEYKEAFEESYVRLLGCIQKLARNGDRDAIVVVGNIYEPDWDGFRATEQAKVLDYVNEFIAKKVAAYGFQLADIHGAFLGREKELLVYGIEPGLRGGSVIADLFESAMYRATANQPA